ncbi:MAG TPA: hypothetical protein VIH01_12545 [Blastococcus sp.]
MAPFDERGLERDAASNKVPQLVAVRPGVLPRQTGGTVLGLVLRAETHWTPVQR